MQKGTHTGGGWTVGPIMCSLQKSTCDHVVTGLSHLEIMPIITVFKTTYLSIE